MRKLSRRILLANFVAFCAVSQVSATELTMFPGKVAALKSPDGKHEIFDVDKGFAADGEQNRKLYVRRSNGKGKRLLLSYHRCVDVAWSPDGSAFVVNDNAGSNLVVPYLFQVNDLKHPVEITPRLMDALQDKKDKSDIEQSDVFSLVFASRWINQNELELTVKGAGQKVGLFTILYAWDLKNRFKKLKRTDD